MTQSAFEASNLIERISLREQIGSTAGVRFYSCIDTESGEEYEAARWDFGKHSGDTVRALMEYLRRSETLDFEGVQRPIAFQTDDNGLLVLAEKLEGAAADRRTTAVSAIAPERALYVATELARIVAYVQSAGLPVAVLPAECVVEVPKRGIVLRHPWLVAALPEILFDMEDELPDLQAAVPPEAARGAVPGVRAGVYAVGYLVRMMLQLEDADPNGRSPVLPTPPALRRVLTRATSDAPRKRHRNLRDFAADLDRTRANRRTDIRRASRVSLDTPRRPVRVARERLPLPDRPVPESKVRKISPWMVAAVSAVGILVFMLILPRTANPLVPLTETFEEIRSVFDLNGVRNPRTEGPLSGVVVPGQPFPAPDFRGRQQAEAQIDAERIGLAIDISDEFSSEVPPGEIIRQQPEPGTILTDQYRIRLFVNRGEANAFLTSVVGKTADEARETLMNLGFLVVTVPVFDEERPAGEVIGQRPDSGGVFPKGEQVTLEVSQGPERVVIPTLVGLPEADAVQRASDAGLKVSTEFEVDAPTGFAPGVVFLQEPVGGALVDPESGIVVKVYRPEPVTVPRVIGLEPSQAFSELFASDLIVGSVLERESTGATDTRVIDQSPPAGTKVARDSEVKLTVEKPVSSRPPSPTPTP